MLDFNKIVEQSSDANPKDVKPTDTTAETSSSQVPTKLIRQCKDDVQPQPESGTEPSQSQQVGECDQPRNDGPSLNPLQDQQSSSTSSQPANPVPSLSELQSLDSTFEQICQARPDTPLKAPYSELTIQQVQSIRKSVEEQENETKEKLDKLSQLGSLPAETLFGEDLADLREAIRKAREEEEKTVPGAITGEEDSSIVSAIASKDTPQNLSKPLATDIISKSTNVKSIAEASSSKDATVKSSDPAGSVATDASGASKAKSQSSAEEGATLSESKSSNKSNK